jgi:hypothetical protein
MNALSSQEVSLGLVAVGSAWIIINSDNILAGSIEMLSLLRADAQLQLAGQPIEWPGA